ncbi:FadR/GntR family transcriptional regulator [Vannielia sp. SX4]|uniref:FadR/GntR family transcriptional regulator n=1 Tax=Vannielia sp. SX4 TaxID=3463852 RepID=UPI004059B05C
MNRTIKPVRVYRQVADSLEARIADGEFEPGQRLTTERDLSREYGVSRTCIREALLALEIAGLVTIKVGSGVFVLPPQAPDQIAAVPAAMPDQNSPSDILQSRLALEPHICRLAASAASAEDLDTIDGYVQKMREEHRMATETENGDREFHFAIARAAQNPMLLEFLQRVWDEMTGPMWQALQRHIRTPLMRLKWIEDHEVIIAALRSGSPDAAQSAMHAHIEHVMEALEKAKFR